MPDHASLRELDAELLERYLTGRCSLQESAAVRRYLMKNPQVEQALEGYLHALAGADGRPAPPEMEASWATLRDRLRAEDAARPLRVVPAKASPLFPSTRRGLRWVAAVAGLGIAAGGALMIRSGERAAVETPTVASRTYATPVRERAEFRLPDGTRVRLAPASRLRVAADFGVTRRDVYLDEGEAYFDVVHNSPRPFTVFAANSSVRDIGTAFAVRSLAAEARVRVVVREGVVALSGAGLLKAGDVGRLAANGTVSVQRNVRTDALLAWVDGRLAFEDAPLAEVVADLSRWHGVEVRLADSTLKQLLFTGDLHDAGATQGIETVAATLGLNVTHEGNLYSIARRSTH